MVFFVLRSEGFFFFVPPVRITFSKTSTLLYAFFLSLF